MIKEKPVTQSITCYKCIIDYVGGVFKGLIRIAVQSDFMLQQFCAFVTANSE